MFINHAINILYPATCGICGRISKDSLCNKCETKLKNELFIKIENYEKDNSKYFDEHIYFCEYKGIIRQRILDYKFNEKSYLNEFFSKIILKNEKIYVHLKKYDIIVPVPIHKKRKQKRGYNQSELIARIISKHTGITTQNLLLKVQNNLPQSRLNKEERMINIKNVYKAKNRKIIRGKKVLLVDDIFTTGNTANECAKELKKIGVKTIGVLTIAKD